MYRLEDIGKSFVDGTGSRWVVRGLSASIEVDQPTVLWGPSGSGKTTVLNILSGLLIADEGRLKVDIEKSTIDLESCSDKERLAFRRKHVGFVFQSFNLVPTLTVAENIELPLELAKRLDLRSEALTRLSDLGLEDRSDAFPNQLSAGEQQRVAILRALAHRPHVLLADEPTGNLDAENTEIVADLLWSTAMQTNTMLVVATHNDSIRRRCAQVIELGT